MAQHCINLRRVKDYFGMFVKQPSNKIALIDDELVYTYGDLVQLAKVIRTGDMDHALAKFIHANSIADQLIQFIAYSGTKTVPIIATELSKSQVFMCEEIPPKACMGVMTSGSTGKSKLLWRNFGSWAYFFEEQNRVFDIDENTVIFCQGSLAFTGNLSIYMGVFAAGGTVVATEKFLPRHWIKLMEQHHVNAIYLIPSKLMLLPKFLHQMKKQMPAIKTMVSGSQSMGRHEAERLKEAFPEALLTLYYGASELNYITYIRGDEMTDDRTDIGLPFKGVEVTVKNEEIFVNTPYHVEGIDLPFTLKDRGSIDAQGHLHFLGRTDDIVNANGRKVSALKIDDALMLVEGVSEAYVLSVHNGDADDLVAFVASEIKYSKQELVSLLRKSLEDYEVPKQFILLDTLPHNESGKVDKKALYGLTELHK